MEVQLHQTKTVLHWNYKTASDIADAATSVNTDNVSIVYVKEAGLTSIPTNLAIRLINVSEPSMRLPINTN